MIMIMIHELEWEVERNLTQVKVINLFGHTTGEIQNKELSMLSMPH